MLDTWNAGVSVDGICTRHVTYCIKEMGKGLFEENDIMDCHCGKAYCLRLVWMVLLAVRVFRAGLSFMPWGWEGISGWVDSRGVWNVTFFAVFLLLGIITASRRIDGASFSTLNSKIPSLSKAAYESRGMGSVLCCTSAMTWPKSVGVPPWDIQVWDIGCRAPFFGFLDLVT